MKDCENCIYFGKAADAPETVEKDCIFVPSEEDGDTKPCEEEE